jgi:hypothetical protein
MRTSPSEPDAPEAPEVRAAVTVLPADLPITVYAGDDVGIPVTVNQAGEPLTLGDDHLSQIRDVAEGDVVLGTITIEVVDPAAGQAVMRVAGVMTDALIESPLARTVTWQSDGVVYRQKQFTGVYDWQSGTKANSDVVTFCRGAFKVEGDVTRETP